MSGWVLFSGVVGAFLVFVLGIYREEWRRDQEVVGILRLLKSEIEYNVAVIQTLEFWWHQKGGDIDMNRFPQLKAEVWLDVRARVARLLPEDLITALNDYYSPLDNVLTLKDQDPKKRDHSNRVMMDVLAELPERMYTAPPLGYSDYALYVLEAQNTARQQVEDYLALPPLMRYPITGWAVEFVFRKRGGNNH